MTREEFKQSLVAFSERVIKFRPHLKNEESTKISLVLPFIATLGYDVSDPSEVSAEHSADFAEKYKNRVDYAILRDGLPVVAIECKSLGNTKRDDRGQLKSYFNASKSVKIGVLTDGAKFEFFIDSTDPNMMDDEPFLVVCFDENFSDALTDTVLDSLFGLTRVNFNPSTVSDNARYSFAYNAFSSYIERQFNNPSDEFTRFILRENNILHVRNNLLDGYRVIAKRAFQDVFNSNVLRRLDINQSAAQSTAVKQNEPQESVLITDNRVDIAPTGEELALFDHFCMKMAYLCSGNRELFDETEELDFQKFKGKFVIFFNRVQRGRLLEVYKNKNGSFVYSICDGMPDRDQEDLDKLDARLIELFKQVVAAEK